MTFTPFGSEHDGPTAHADQSLADRALAEVLAERATRTQELQEARDRLVVAEARWHVLQVETRLELGELTAAAEAALARLEDEHRRLVDSIVSGAAQQAEEILGGTER